MNTTAKTILFKTRILLFSSPKIFEVKSNDIVAGIHYPVPTHLMPAYVQGSKPTVYLPNAERIAKKVVSLPIYPELAESDQYRVINALKDFF